MSSAKDWTIRIDHILDAIQQIQTYLQGLTFEEFESNRMVVDAVVRNFQIIGEAVRQIPEEHQRKHATIPWRDMRNMRHRLIHRYEHVDAAIVWTTSTNDLPPLVPLLRQLRDASRPSGS